MHASRLHWMRGRPGQGQEGTRAMEWIGCDEAGQAVARVVRIRGPLPATWEVRAARAAVPDAQVVALRPTPPHGVDWLAYVGGRVVGRAALPLQAVRTVEESLS